MSTEVKCYLCGDPTDEENHCFSCGKTICDDCDQTEPTGSHEPEDHKEEADG